MRARAVHPPAEVDAGAARPPAATKARWLCSCNSVPTYFLSSLLVVNWMVHVWLRPSWWHGVIVVSGHGLLALVVASWLQCVLTHPGEPTASWRADAAAGREDCTKYSDGTCVPPRAHYVHRRREVILHFDHHCWWLDVPIGRLNRKFFLLFVLYAMLLSGFSAGLCLHDVHVDYANIATYMSPLGAHALRFGRDSSTGIILLAIALSELETSHAVRCLGLVALFAVDVVACFLLGLFSIMHLRMAWRNQTTLNPKDEEQYDRGSATANLRDVFGSQAWLWPLPVWRGDLPAGDGMHWERREGMKSSSA